MAILTVYVVKEVWLTLALPVPVNVGEVALAVIEKLDDADAVEESEPVVVAWMQ